LASDRVWLFVRLGDAVSPEAAGRVSDWRIGSKSVERTINSKAKTGFPNPNVIDQCAHSGRWLLELALYTAVSWSQAGHAIARTGD
jgi:hypothetical protein